MVFSEPVDESTEVTNRGGHVWEEPHVAGRIPVDLGLAPSMPHRPEDVGVEEAIVLGGEDRAVTLRVLSLFYVLFLSAITGLGDSSSISERRVRASRMVCRIASKLRTTSAVQNLSPSYGELRGLRRPW